MLVFQQGLKITFSHVFLGAYCLNSQQSCYTLIGLSASTDPCTGLASGSTVGPCNTDGTCPGTSTCLPNPTDFTQQECLCP